MPSHVLRVVVLVLSNNVISIVSACFVYPISKLLVDFVPKELPVHRQFKYHRTSSAVQNTLIYVDKI